MTVLQPVFRILDKDQFASQDNGSGSCSFIQYRVAFKRPTKNKFFYLIFFDYFFLTVGKFTMVLENHKNVEIRVRDSTIHTVHKTSVADPDP